MKDQDAYIEKIARIITYHHCGKELTVNDSFTVSLYIDDQWRGYIPAAKAVITTITNDCVEALRQRQRNEPGNSDTK
jgi:hypothetical protein